MVVPGVHSLLHYRKFREVQLYGLYETIAAETNIADIGISRSKIGPISEFYSEMIAADTNRLNIAQLERKCEFVIETAHSPDFQSFMLHEYSKITKDTTQQLLIESPL